MVGGEEVGEWVRALACADARSCPPSSRVPGHPTPIPLRPILIPRLRIEFADFPCMLSLRARGCVPRRPAAVMWYGWIGVLCEGPWSVTRVGPLFKGRERGSGLVKVAKWQRYSGRRRLSLIKSFPAFAAPLKRRETSFQARSRVVSWAAYQALLPRLPPFVQYRDVNRFLIC